MKKPETLTRDQLIFKIKKASEKLYAAVEPLLEFNFINENDSDDDDFSDFLGMLDPETAERIKAAALNIDNESDEPEILLMQNESTMSLDLVSQQGEGFKIILIENDINLSGNLFIEEYVTLIVTGQVKAKNIIVNGSLYTSESLFCNVLFGASGNDHQTYIGGNIHASLIAENGQYTVSEGEIYSKYLISFHNEIEGKSGKFIEYKNIESENETSVLNPEILDENGFFDEDSFLNYINRKDIESLFI
ncbi:hypothetical protein [Chryseobacterium sp. 52]|uniref:hypothetical protein n=1 Tax=Chryseobacterium sp. 52 TaxID=2035213 RepID=UPI001180C6A6|nr:hypothetical protein [Chryseobacterium sp. 52]